MKEAIYCLIGFLMGFLIAVSFNRVYLIQFEKAVRYKTQIEMLNTVKDLRLKELENGL